MGVTSGSSVLKFTLKELEDLVNDVDSQVYLKKDVKYPLKLTPACLQNVNQAITEILTAERLKYIPKYKGLLLAYKHVRRHSNMGTINDDECNILIHIHVDLYIFAPEIGCTMTGIVSKISEDNIGCLVHKGFNVTLPQPRNEGSATWLGNSVRLGDEVKFKLDTFNVVGTLPYIRGSLLSHKAVKRESELMDFSEECDLPPKKKLSTVEKRKKHTFEEEETVVSESLKRLSKKKKKLAIMPTDDGDNFMEESLPKLIKAKKERKTSEKSEFEVTSTSDTISVKKAKKEKKRKSDPSSGLSIELEPQISTKKRKKSLSKSSIEASGGGYKTSLLQSLQSDDEGGDDKIGSQTKALNITEGKKEKKSKSAVPKQNLTVDNETDLSVKELMRNVIKDISGETKKSMMKPKKSLADLLASDESDDSYQNEAAKTPHPLQNMNSKYHWEDKALKKDRSIETSPTKKLKTPKLKAKTDSITGTKKSAGSAKKVEGSTTDDVGEMSIEALMQRALENVSGKTPKPKKSRALYVSDGKQIPKESPGKNRTENEVVGEAASVKKKKRAPENPLQDNVGALAQEELYKSPKSKSKTKLSDLLNSDDDSISQTPSKWTNRASKSGLMEFVVPKPEELKVQDSKSPKKKLKTKPNKHLDNEETMQMTSKLTDNSETSSTKKKGSKSSLLDFLHEDIILPKPEELLAKMQEQRTKSPKKEKHNKTNISENGEIVQTPSKLAAKSKASSPKKIKGKKALTMDDDFNLPTPAEILAKVLEEQKISPKKKGKTNMSDFLGSKDVLPTPSKGAAISETDSSKKRKKSKSGLSDSLHEDVTIPKPAELLASMQEEVTKSPKKKNKTKPTELSDSREIVQTPTENPESSRSKRKSKSILLGLLSDGSASPPVAKTPAKIRKAFVQSPISDVAKTSKTPKEKKAPASAGQTPPPSLPPLPSLGQLSTRKEEKSASKQGSPAKKLRKSEAGTLSLLDKLLSQEKSMQLVADESSALTQSSKKKSKK